MGSKAAVRRAESPNMHLAAWLGALGAALFCLPSPVWGENAGIRVDISGKSVTLTCPLGNAKWEEKVGGAFRAILKHTDVGPYVITAEKELKAVEEGKYFRCAVGGGEARAIFLKARVCEGCVELGVGLVGGLVAADLLITLGTLVLVYYCSKKRAAGFGGGLAKGGPRGRPRGPKVDRPPPVPNPDYEPIRKGQREVYAGLEPRAF
ncbi:T-cell surface glycoprotein CD3 epsilon chain [Elgaria multicarinata webbii]|uniref:T-cell surface glycoprotein CD3 epsilon chain n=1 Tax=Elgaria multicarinata webbii TaxID=159646 RepID=UPI002FCCDCAF